MTTSFRRTASTLLAAVAAAALAPAAASAADITLDSARVNVRPVLPATLTAECPSSYPYLGYEYRWNGRLPVWEDISSGSVKAF